MSYSSTRSTAPTSAVCLGKRSRFSRTARARSSLSVIGTMNLIDQSVEQIDFALRRRFRWEQLGFEPEAIPIVVETRSRSRSEFSRRYPWEMLESEIQWLADHAALLNREIAGSNYVGSQYEIGHTY